MDESEHNYEQAWEIHQQYLMALREMDHNRLNLLMHWVIILKSLGHFDEALNKYQQAWQIHQQYFMYRYEYIRKAAKVNMNDASAGMKEWRRAQTAQAAPVTVQVPDSVKQASSAAIATLWQQAQELANESLRAAQAGWESEHAESDRLSKQMADAYEAQERELNAAMARVGELEAAQRQMAESAQAQSSWSKRRQI